MLGKVGLEEHFALPETVLDSTAQTPTECWDELRGRLLDIHDRRLYEMDANGMEMMILSLNSPTVQAIPSARAANEFAMRANDFLAEQVAARPDRFQAFAALPLQDPELAARELERCMTQLGFKGALVNGFSQIDDPENIVYYDAPQFAGFWDEVEKLDAPFYLHPRNPLPSRAQIYEGHPWLMGPPWAFGQETAVHALRLMASGLFDRNPALKIVLGHLGEGLPYSMWRVDNYNAWLQGNKKYPAEHPLGYYFSKNFYLTTSGNFRTQTLIDAILEIGSDRIMFSTDWPFEDIDAAAHWFDTTSISEADRLKIGRTNAQSLFKLQLDDRHCTPERSVDVGAPR
jgi:2,3-dihydroxybenzoate decarboxylase